MPLNKQVFEKWVETYHSLASFLVVFMPNLLPSYPARSRTLLHHS